MLVKNIKINNTEIEINKVEITTDQQGNSETRFFVDTFEGKYEIDSRNFSSLESALSYAKEIILSNIKTVKLNKYANCAEVLAKQTKEYGITAYTFVNIKQANSKAELLKNFGIDCKVIGRYPFYVSFSNW